MGNQTGVGPWDHFWRGERKPRGLKLVSHLQWLRLFLTFYTAQARFLELLSFVSTSSLCLLWSQVAEESPSRCLCVTHSHLSLCQLSSRETQLPSRESRAKASIHRPPSYACSMNRDEQEPVPGSSLPGGWERPGLVSPSHILTP